MSKTTSTHRAGRAAALLSLLALGACATPLIAGECAEGYSLIDGSCIAECRPGFERRGGYCRLAEGLAAMIGLDFADAVPGDSASQILGNAVFLGDHQPVHILDYRALTAWNSSAVSNTVDLIAAEAVARRRTVTTHVAVDGDDVLTHLDRGQTDVFILHDSSQAAPGELGQLGAAWAASIDAFLAQRGVVVVLAGTGGVHEMGSFLHASGLLRDAQVVDAGAGPLHVEAPDDVMSRNLPDRLGSVPRSAAFTSSETPSERLAYVVATDADQPVVVRRSRAFESPAVVP